MESALPMLIFLGSLLGVGTLILICMQQSVDLERAEQEAERAKALEALAKPSFFLQAQTAPAVAVDDAVVQRLERYVQEQEALAERFVERPSARLLLRRAESEPRPQLLDRLEAYLRAEQDQVVEFLARPSVERLHGRGVAAVAA